MKKDLSNIKLSIFLFFVMLSYGVTIPVIPFKIIALGASSFILGIAIGSYSLAQIVSAPLWGMLVNRSKSRCYLIAFLSTYIVVSLSIGLADDILVIIIGRFLSGCILSYTIIYAMNLIKSEDKGNCIKGYGIISGAIGLGILCGMGFGGCIAKVGEILPFIVSSIITLSIIPFLFFVTWSPSLNYSHRKENGKMNSLKESSFVIFLSIAFLSSIAIACFDSTFAVLLKDRFNFTAREFGFLLFVVGGIALLIQATLSKTVVYKFGMLRTVEIGLVAISLFFVILSFGPKMNIVIGCLILLVVGLAFIKPTMLSIVARSFSKCTGENIGLICSVVGLGRFIGSPIAGGLYSINVSYPYILSAIIIILCLLISLIYRKRFARIEL